MLPNPSPQWMDLIPHHRLTLQPGKRFVYSRPEGHLLRWNTCAVILVDIPLQVINIKLLHSGFQLLWSCWGCFLHTRGRFPNTWLYDCEDNHQQIQLKLADELVHNNDTWLYLEVMSWLLLYLYTACFRSGCMCVCVCVEVFSCLYIYVCGNNARMHKGSCILHATQTENVVQTQAKYALLANVTALLLHYFTYLWGCTLNSSSGGLRHD